MATTTTHATQLQRIFVSTSKMVIQNVEVPFYQKITAIHELIDSKHDQLDTGRGSDLKSNDKNYKDRLIKAINISSMGNTSTFNVSNLGVSSPVAKDYNVNSGIHTLENALERVSDSITIDSIPSPTLPSLYVLPWDCQQIETANPLPNSMVVYKKFNTDSICDNAKAGQVVKTHTDIQSNGFISDSGPDVLFASLTGTPPENPGKKRNIISGKMDSSSSSGLADKIDEKTQVLIPFMSVYNTSNQVIGVIMIYMAPITLVEARITNLVKDNYCVFIGFTYIPSVDYRTIYSNPTLNPLLSTDRFANITTIITDSANWTYHVETNQAPDLPDISEYMAGARGCLSSIYRFVTNKNQRLENVCGPYRLCGDFIMGKIPTGTIFGSDADLFNMAFLMRIKHMGDKTRLIDAFMLTEMYNESTATGSVDTFLMRYACLGNLYVYCVNKNGGNLVINDVKTLSADQLADIATKATATKMKQLNLRIETYKSYITLYFDTLLPNQRILTDLKNNIYESVLAPGKMRQKSVRLSSRGKIQKFLTGREAHNVTDIMYEFIGNPSLYYFDINQMNTILRFYVVLLLYETAFNNVINIVNPNSKEEWITDLDGLKLKSNIASETYLNGMTNFIRIIENYNIIYQNILNKQFLLTNDSLFQLAQRLVVKTPKIEINQEEWLNIFIDFTKDEVPNPYVLKFMYLDYTPDVGKLIEEITTSDEGMYGGSKKQSGGGKQEIHNEIMTLINVQKKIVDLPPRLNIDSLRIKVTEIQALLDYYNDLKNYGEIFTAETDDEIIIEQQIFYTNKQTLLKIRLLFLELNIQYPLEMGSFSIVFANELMNYDKVFNGLNPVINLLNSQAYNNPSVPAVTLSFTGTQRNPDPNPDNLLKRKLPQRNQNQTGFKIPNYGLLPNNDFINYQDSNSVKNQRTDIQGTGIQGKGGTNKTIKKRKHRKTIKRKRRKTNKKIKTIKRSYIKRKTRHAFAHHL